MTVLEILARVAWTILLIGLLVLAGVSFVAMMRELAARIRASKEERR